MTPEEALLWLRDVEGRLYRSRPHASGREAWVAVVFAPPNGMKRAQLIVALGGSREEAAAAAEAQWRELWRDLSRVH